MKSKNAVRKFVHTPNIDPDNMIKKCQKCANQFVLVWLAKGRGYSDFGDRHCPFCGL